MRIGSWSILLGLLLLACYALLDGRAPAWPGRNLSFEEASKADPTKPAGWFAGGEGYEAFLDGTTTYDGRFSLRLRAVNRVQFGVATQCLPAEFAAGHLLRLVGYIKTENVERGYAGLWLRVDLGARQLQLENMRGFGARGTTPWTRYEIAVSVAANADQICFGVLLPADGTAWFDSLALEVDPESQVPDAVVAAPLPKPEYADTLLSDEALATVPDKWSPGESAAVTAWVQANHYPIRSLLAENHSDLQFLKPLLAGKRIVALGESGHGVAEFNLAKVRLIEFLHQELGFDVIAFESSLYECFRANERAEEVDALTTMRSSIFGVWHTQEVMRLFEYIRRSHDSDRPLILAGFDVQESSQRGVRTRPLFFHEIVARVDSAYADEIREFDRGFLGRPPSFENGKAYFVDNGERLAATYDSLAAFLRQHEAELARSFTDRPAWPLVARQTAWSLGQFVRGKTTDDMTALTAVRDSGMADNLDFLLDELYPDRKIILWGHNFHLRHDNAAVEPDPLRTMGSWVAKRHRDEMYTVGLYMYRGHATQNDRDAYPVWRGGSGSLESILHQARKKYLFVDLSRAERTPGSEWIFTPIKAKSWGTLDLTLIPRDQYDSILFVDTATPPEYAR